MIFPEMVQVRQALRSREIEDLAAAVRSALAGINLAGAAKPGGSCAVAVGSRGINHIRVIVLECVSFLKAHGLKPFIVPAMGSHGGGTPDGERSVLAGLGIDEAFIGVPILASDHVVEVGRLDVGVPILLDAHAAAADHIVVINRVKPHTKFKAQIESGLTKMLTVGLGKRRGAALYHRAAVQHTFGILQDAAGRILESRSVLFGMAVLEDGYRNVCLVSAVTPENWFDTERSLLKEARSMMPSIPFDPIDILIVDEIGKEISGIGMDSNVTGRHRDIVGDFNGPPHVKRIFVRDLSPRSDGNANGIGLADVTTRRLVDAIDLDKTYANALTAISPEKAAIPINFETDRQCVEACLNTIGMVEPGDARIVRIKNTARLDILLISRALEQDMAANPDLQITGPWQEMSFDARGNLAGLE